MKIKNLELVRKDQDQGTYVVGTLYVVYEDGSKKEFCNVAERYTIPVGGDYVMYNNGGAVKLRDDDLNEINRYYVPGQSLGTPCSIAITYSRSICDPIVVFHGFSIKQDKNIVNDIEFSDRDDTAFRELHKLLYDNEYAIPLKIVEKKKFKRGDAVIDIIRKFKKEPFKPSIKKW